MLIFIDTNLYQQPIRSSDPTSKDFDDLNKLLRKKGKTKFTLIVTDQVYDEYYRAEESCIKSARKRVEEAKSPVADVLDLMLKKEFGSLSSPEKAILKGAKRINDAFTAQASKERRLREFEKKSTRVRNAINDAISNAKLLSCDEIVFRAAEMRVRRGMHPRANSVKDSDASQSSVGDAINWELLLRYDDDEDYVLITKDSDFITDNGVLHRTLQDEWKKRHAKASLTVYRSLYEFLEAVGGTKRSKKKRKKNGPASAGPSPKPEMRNDSRVLASGLTPQTVIGSIPPFGNFDTHSHSIAAGDGVDLGSLSMADVNSRLFLAIPQKDQMPTMCPFCGEGQIDLVPQISFVHKNRYVCRRCGGGFEV